MILPERRLIVAGSATRQTFRDSQKVRLHHVGPAGRAVRERPDGPEHGCRADGDLHVAKVDPHTVNAGVHLLIVAHVGADAQSVSTGMFDFELSQIQLGLAARQQPDARALRRKADRQPLPDSPGRRR